MGFAAPRDQQWLMTSARAAHLGIAALDGVEVEVFGVGTGHRGRSAAAHPDPHPRTTELDQQRPRGEDDLLGLDAPRSSRGPPALMIGFVIAAADAGDGLLEDPEEPAHRPELVVERRGPSGAADHDVERAGDVAGCTVLAPRLFGAWQLEIRHGVNL